MWTSETRLHEGLQSWRRRHYLSTAPCFHQQPEVARACMTSVGMWGKKCVLLIGSTEEGGVPEEGSRRGIEQWEERRELPWLQILSTHSLQEVYNKVSEGTVNAYLTRISKIWYSLCWTQWYYEVMCNLQVFILFDILIFHCLLRGTSRLS